MEEKVTMVGHNTGNYNERTNRGAAAIVPWFNGKSIDSLSFSGQQVGSSYNTTRLKRP